MDELEPLDFEPKQEKNQRTGIITVICILGFIGTVITIPLAFTDAVKAIGSWYPPYLVFSATIGFICMVGMWQMKKWGVYLYTSLAVFNQVVLLSIDIWTFLSLIAPAIVVGIAWSQINKME